MEKKDPLAHSELDQGEGKKKKANALNNWRKREEESSASRHAVVGGDFGKAWVNGTVTGAASSCGHIE